nr:DUF916 domain-containing protein [Kineosporia mesophila]
MKTTAAVVLALATTLLGAGTASAATDDVTWTVRTASNDLGDSRTSFSYDLKPGATLDDAMVVANRGNAPLTLKVYAADGFTTEAGQMDLVTKDAESIGVGAWVHAERASVLVEPGKTAELPFTVQIPENATPGDHAGGIITSLTQADSDETINVDRRLGIQIKLRVDGDLKPAVAIEDLSVGYQGTLNPAGKGSTEVSYTLRNTGNAILSGSAATSLKGPFGWFKVSAGQSGLPQQLLPGERWKVTGTIAGVVPSGRLSATTHLLPVITDAAGSTTSLPAISATTHAWALPWTLLLVIVALIALIVTAVVVSRRNRARRKAREDARVEEAVKEALQAQ